MLCVTVCCIFLARRTWNVHDFRLAFVIKSLRKLSQGKLQFNATFLNILLISVEYVEILNETKQITLTWLSPYCTSCLPPPSSPPCVLPSPPPLTPLVWRDWIREQLGCLEPSTANEPQTSGKNTPHYWTEHSCMQGLKDEERIK